MNLVPKFIVIGIIFAMSIGVLEGAPSIKITEKLSCTTPTETTEPQYELKPESSETTEPALLPPPKPCFHPPTRPSSSCPKPKQCSDSPRPLDCGAAKPGSHNIFSHFYGYFTWMAQFYKWVEKYGKWMAGGVNHMFC